MSVLATGKSEKILRKKGKVHHGLDLFEHLIDTSLRSISSPSGFSQRIYFSPLSENIHYKNEELCMKWLKAEKCFKGPLWVERGENIWQGICSCNVFASWNISKEIESHDLILERCQLLGKKTLKGFSKIHSIGQSNANCKTQRLILIHFACLEESFKPLKIQRGSYI